MNRLYDQYLTKIVPNLQKELGIKNKLAVPRVTKVVVNIGIGDIARDKTKQAKAIATIAQICGQQPRKMPAKIAISEFRIRRGDLVGLKVTLRGRRMYQFLDKLITIVLPRIRDFQGVKITAFDKRANYTLGLTEQIVFPEVDYDKIDRSRGLEVTIVTSTNNRDHAHRLLELMGMPFEKPNIKDKN